MIEWLLFSLLAVLIQGFFALFEMSCVSFQKVRLQYWVSLHKKRALWIQYLLKKPSRLFGTTLIGINAALQVGSECARQFYESIHLDPDWAPVSQVVIVVILGELVPMFAARRHPEKIATFCVPVVMLLARLLTPITWLFDQLSKVIHRLIAKPEATPLFLSREEVRLAFEPADPTKEEWNAMVNAIFDLKHWTAQELMLPLAEVRSFPAHLTIQELRVFLAKEYVPILPLYSRQPQNIVAIANVRDLLRREPHDLVQAQAKPPWFVTADTSILTLLDQFRMNNQKVAVILEAQGQAIGILTLDQIIDALCGEEKKGPVEEEASHFVERTLEGSMSIQAFNAQFGADLPVAEAQTLSALILAELQHPPAKGEVIRIGVYEFTVLEPTLRGVKTLSVHTLQE